MEDKEYIEWFNKGYIISENKPDLAAKISDALSKYNNERAIGFKDGHNQYSVEREQSKQPGYLRAQNYLPKSTLNHDPVKQKDIDMDKM